MIRHSSLPVSLFMCSQSPLSISVLIRLPLRSVWYRMSVRSLLATIFLLVLPILGQIQPAVSQLTSSKTLTSHISGARADSEVEEVEGSGTVLEGPSPNTKPYKPYKPYNPYNNGYNTNTRPWLGNQGMTRPWNQPWRPQPRQWRGPMGHVVPSFSAPRQNNGPWQQAPPPPIVQQVTTKVVVLEPDRHTHRSSENVDIYMLTSD